MTSLKYIVLLFYAILIIVIAVAIFKEPSNEDILDYKETPKE